MSGLDPRGTGPGEHPDAGPTHEALLDARARVVHDLAARGLDDAPVVDLVDRCVRRRRWWLDAWPQGAEHVAGQVAQDVQEALLDDRGVRWPLCPVPHDGDPAGPRDPHALHVLPDLGPDPQWVCEDTATAVGAVGDLGAAGC